MCKLSKETVRIHFRVIQQTHREGDEMYTGSDQETDKHKVQGKRDMMLRCAKFSHLGKQKECNMQVKHSTPMQGQLKIE